MNPWPPHCERGALPAELHPQVVKAAYIHLWDGRQGEFYRNHLLLPIALAANGRSISFAGSGPSLRVPLFVGFWVLAGQAAEALDGCRGSG